MSVQRKELYYFDEETSQQVGPITREELDQHRQQGRASRTHNGCDHTDAAKSGPNG